MASVRKPKTRKQASVPLPKRPTTVDEWIEAKAKAPAFFSTTPEGDAIVPPYKEGETQNVLMINPLVPANRAFIEGFFAKRKEELQVAEEEFANAKRALHDIVRSYRNGDNTASEVASANAAVFTAQARVNSIAKYPRDFEQIKDIEQYDLTFDWYRRGKFAMHVGAYTPSTFPWKAFWMPPSAQAPVEELLEPQEEQEGGGNPKKNYTPKQRAIIANIMKKRYSNA
jgi:predicted metal-dependent hydrolase